MDVEYRATEGDTKEVVTLLIPLMSAGSSMVNREAEKPSVCVNVKAIRALVKSFIALSPHVN